MCGFQAGRCPGCRVDLNRLLHDVKTHHYAFYLHCLKTSTLLFSSQRCKLLINRLLIDYNRLIVAGSMHGPAGSQKVTEGNRWARRDRVEFTKCSVERTTHNLGATQTERATFCFFRTLPAPLFCVIRKKASRKTKEKISRAHSLTGSRACKSGANEKGGRAETEHRKDEE